ncbi:MAG: hypothetical protein WCN95_10775, partial [bacterium]
EAAREAAYRDALATISKEILSQVRIEGGRASLTSGFAFRGAEIMTGCIHLETTKTGVSCWVQISYPLGEKDKLVQRIKLGEKLDGLWSEAKSSYHRGEYGQAIANLKTVVADYENALCASFDIEAAKVLLGDACVAQKAYPEAMSQYDNVIGLSSSAPKWVTIAKEKRAGILNEWKPPRFWPMRDRWQGKKVAILCAIREGADLQKFPDLYRTLTKDCTDARMECADLWQTVTPDIVAALFDKNDTTAVVGASVGSVTLAILAEVDPAKQGKSEQIMGFSASVPDTTVHFLVMVSGQSAVLHYTGQFKEVKGHGSETKLAERIANILIRKYLVPECPALGSK